MFKRLILFICASLICFIGPANAQQSVVESRTQFMVVPLNVPEGYPLEIVLAEKLRYKVDEPVHGRIVQPVYAFDREVIPPGTEVLGRITGFRSGGKLKRISSWLGGDFTPVRNPEITFDTLLLGNGTRLPIKTVVEPGAGALVRFADDTKKIENLKSTLETNAPTHGLVATTAQGENEFKRALWNLAPYHPQSMPAGVRYRATLEEQLEFGSAILGAGALDRIGSDAPTGSTLRVRLQTPLNSRATESGERVTAVLTEPVFSSDGFLVFPVGSRLVGEVSEVRSAGKLHRNGELAFKFTQIEPPAAIYYGQWPAQPVDGSLAGVWTSPNMNQLRIGSEGALRITESRERFLAPALSAFSLSRGFNNSADSFGSALAGAYGSNLIKRFLGGGSGLGLPAGIAGRMVPPLGIGLSIYGVGRAVFFNLLARGQEINFPVGTRMEIRLDAER